MISPEEMKIRIDLAALYRIAAMMGWDDLIFTHISARVPAKDSWVEQDDGSFAASKVDHFLINPYGKFFEEMTASCLVKVDQDAKLIDKTSDMINPAGFTIHSAVHAALHQANFVIHLHTDHMSAVSAQKHGLLPLTQNATLLMPQLAYHDYEGVALNLEERERIVRDMGEKQVLILRNHGSLTWGATAGEAMTLMYFLEQACRQQVLALSCGRDGVLEIASDVCATNAGLSRGLGMVGALVWPGLIRRLDRNLPGYEV